MPDGDEIYEPENVKHLGVCFDNEFKFKRQIDIITCKISRHIGVFWKTPHLTTDTKN